MQARRSFFKSQLGKIILTCAGLYMLTFIWSKVLYYFALKDEPPVITQLVKKAKSSKRILNKIGEITDWKYTYNEHDLEKDSLKLYIGLAGEKATIKINAMLAKNAQSGWHIIKSDTTYSE